MATAAAAAPTTTTSSCNTGGVGETSYNITIERRQAISMERLNIIKNSPTSRYLSQIHQLNRGITSSHSNDFIGCKDSATSNTIINNSGSLSSGSNSSIDESASDAEQQQQQQASHHFHLNSNTINNHHHNHHHHHQHQHHHSQLVAPTRGGDRPAGLSRSASRVSRFKSAKEFFERLSSINSSNGSSVNNSPNDNNNNNSPHLNGSATKYHHLNSHNLQQHQRTVLFRPIKRSPERTQHQPQPQHRGNVASRYTEPLAASLGQLTTTGSPAVAPVLSRQTSSNGFTTTKTNLSHHQQQQYSPPAVTNLQPSNSIHGQQQAVKNGDAGVVSTPPPRITRMTKTQPGATHQEGTKSSIATMSNNSPLSERLAVPEPKNGSNKIVTNFNLANTNATVNANTDTNAATTKAAAATDATPPPPQPPTIPRPRSLPIQPQQAILSPPPSAVLATPLSPPRTLALPHLSNSSSCSSAYVKLKTTDHSGLSTNTILHINNSHLNGQSRNNNNCSNSTNNSVINGGNYSCNNNSNNNQHHQDSAVLAFQGDNVIIGSGLLLVKRNKQLRIKFDESSTATFEYPSEEALMDELSSSGSNDGCTEANQATEQQSSAPASQSKTNSSQVTMATATCPALQSASGLLPNQRLMWRQSFGLLLSNQNNLDNNLESPPKLPSPSSQDNLHKQATPTIDCRPVVVVDQKDDQWKGEW